MPVSSNFYLPSNNYPGSSGYVTGGQFPSIYGSYYDHATGRVRSNNPYSQVSFNGVPQVVPNVTVNGVNPYSQLWGGTQSVNSTPASGVKAQLLGAPAAPGAGGGYNPDAPVGAGYNPFFTVANTKSPELAAPINQLLGDWQTLRGLNPTNLVTDAMAKANPDYQKYLSQETGAVSQYYNGDVQKALDALRAQRGAAYQTATDRALGQLSRVLATNQMAQGGGGTVGTGSYISKQALDTAANLNAQSALDQAQQAYQDYNQVLQGQIGLAGQRGNLTTADITRQLLPSQVGANWFNSLVQALGPVAAMQLQNTFYGLGGQQPGGVYVQGGGVPNSTPVAPMTRPQIPVGAANPVPQLLGTPGNPNVVTQYQNVQQGALADPYYGWWGGAGPSTNPYSPGYGTVPPQMLDPGSWIDSPSPIYVPQEDQTIYA